MKNQKNVKKVRLTLISLCLLIFIDSIGIGLIFPIMPELFLNNVTGLIVGSSYYSRDMLYGIAFAVFPLMGFFGMPIFGSLSDSYGRRKMILLGLGGMGVGYLVSALSVFMHCYILFIVSRIVCGFCAGTYTIANAAISDISLGSKGKIQNFRWPVLASILGFILGPAISSVIGFFHVSLKLSTPFLIAVVLSLINWIILFISFKETKLIKSEKAPVFRILFKNISSVIYVLKNPEMRVLSIGYCAFQFGFGLFVQSISLYLAQAFGYTPSNIGLFFIFLGIVIGFSTLVFQPKIGKNINYRSLLLFSLVFMGFLLLIQSFVCYMMFRDIQYFIWVLSGIFYLAIPFATLGSMALFSGLVTRKEQGMAMGGVGQMYSVMWFIAALLIGRISSMQESLILFAAGISLLLSFMLFYYKLIRQNTLTE